MKISDLVYDNIKPLFTGDVKLVEVEYIKKVDGMHLVVYIDKDSGITIEDCVAVNSLIDDTLEKLNPTNDVRYSLDVSSYGLDKPLKYDWQYKKYFNQKVDVKLYRKVNDLKDFVAELQDKDDETVTLLLNGKIIKINLNDVAYIVPHIEF